MIHLNIFLSSQIFKFNFSIRDDINEQPEPSSSHQFDESLSHTDELERLSTGSFTNNGVEQFEDPDLIDVLNEDFGDDELTEKFEEIEYLEDVEYLEEVESPEEIPRDTVFEVAEKDATQTNRIKRHGQHICKMCEKNLPI